MPSLLLVVLLLLLVITTTVSKADLTELPEKTFCNSKLQILTPETWWLTPFSAPCLHPGQPVFRISNSSSNRLQNFYSDEVSLDLNAGIAFSKRRVCFYSTVWDIQLNYQCFNHSLWKKHKLILAHPVFSKEKRKKRWVRRRNPLMPLIHFQQERYIIEIAEDLPVGSLIVKVQATHVNNHSIYYTMSAPENSRSTNLFTLDTITGEIR
uniref:Cadherin domain-containing protein n=1 Tax=Syphacia muris TaxID=451379 RepID=A0A0N5AHE6_9BILA